jgi:CO/xanthine dehydrogenase Mo-binding subunit
MMQSIGFGLRENLHPYYPELDGLSPDFSPDLQATNLADYLIGTTEDMPFLNEALIDYPDPAGPYGAVGMGEFTANCAATAIVNAIHDAIGVRIYSAPCTPERVLAALDEKETPSSNKNEE